MGQEFRPNNSGLTAVQLDLRSVPPAPPATAYVAIRQGRMAGSVVGTSVPTEIGDPGASPPSSPPYNAVQFEFSSVVPLVPGDLYVIELVPLSGAVGLILWGSPDKDGDIYPQGRAIVDGVPWDDAFPAVGPADFWFREGYAMPLEPDDLAGERLVALLLLGGITRGGGGIAILPGGKPVPVPPRDWRSRQTPEVLRGLALAELAGSLLSDPALRRRAEEIGLEAARKALDQWTAGSGA